MDLSSKMMSLTTLLMTFMIATLLTIRPNMSSAISPLQRWISTLNITLKFYINYKGVVSNC